MQRVKHQWLMPFDISVIVLPYNEALELDTTQNVYLEQNDGEMVIARVADTTLYHMDEMPGMLTRLYFGYDPREIKKLILKRFPEYKEAQYEKQLVFFIYLERISL